MNDAPRDPAASGGETGPAQPSTEERLSAYPGYINGYDCETEADQHHAYMVGFSDAIRGSGLGGDGAGRLQQIREAFADAWYAGRRSRDTLPADTATGPQVTAHCNNDLAPLLRRTEAGLDPRRGETPQREWYRRTKGRVMNRRLFAVLLLVLACGALAGAQRRFSLSAEGSLATGGVSVFYTYGHVLFGTLECVPTLGEPTVIFRSRVEDARPSGTSRSRDFAMNVAFLREIVHIADAEYAKHPCTVGGR